MPTDTNIALGRTATASTSVAPYLPAKVVDGNKTATANRWLAYKAPGWVSIDLGQPCAISRWVVCLLPSSGWPSPDYGMAAYELQTSLDNAVWAKADGVTGNAAASTDRTLAAPVLARYVRLWANAGINGNNQVVSLQELEIYGHPVSADLASLVVSGGSLAPSFAPGITTYAQSVPTTTTTVTVTPTAADSTATITVNGAAVVSGQASAPIALSGGAATVAVVVTPRLGAAKTYMVAVTAGQTPAAALTSLVVKPNTGRAMTLNPTFDANILGYTSIAASAVTSVVLTVGCANDTTVTVNGVSVDTSTGTGNVSVMLSGASTTIAIVASGAGKTSTTYTLVVTKS